MDQRDVRKHEKELNRIMKKVIELKVDFKILQRKMNGVDFRPSWKVDAVLNGMQMLFIVDCGSSATIIDTGTYDDLPMEKQPELRRTEHSGLLAADGEYIHIYGEACFCLELGGLTKNITMLVGSIKSKEGILGMDVLQAGSAILDMKNGTLTINGKTITCTHDSIEPSNLEEFDVISPTVQNESRHDFLTEREAETGSDSETEREEETEFDFETERKEETESDSETEREETGFDFDNEREEKEETEFSSEIGSEEEETGFDFVTEKEETDQNEIHSHNKENKELERTEKTSHVEVMSRERKDKSKPGKHLDGVSKRDNDGTDNEHSKRKLLRCDEKEDEHPSISHCHRKKHFKKCSTCRLAKKLAKQHQRKRKEKHHRNKAETSKIV